MLRLEHVSKTFLKGTPNEMEALKDINLHLAPGEFVTIIGSNGAGKSTLFHGIAGEFFCDKGHIFLDGKEITFQKEYKRASSISRIFQDPMKGTAPHLTVAENLALAYSKSQKPMFSFAKNKKDMAYFREVLASMNMGLEDRMETKIGLLSGGQRQVVALLMNTLVMPKLLLLDEHTAALDPVTAQKVLEITRRLVEENHITTMMITHNISSALEMGTRTLMMERGKIVLDLQGENRAHMDGAGLLALYKETCSRELDNDRMLFS